MSLTKATEHAPRAFKFVLKHFYYRELVLYYNLRNSLQYFLSLSLSLLLQFQRLTKNTLPKNETSGAVQSNRIYSARSTKLGHS